MNTLKTLDKTISVWIAFGAAGWGAVTAGLNCILLHADCCLDVAEISVQNLASMVSRCAGFEGPIVVR